MREGTREFIVLRHFHLFVAAPGRQEEAERSLRAWLDGVRHDQRFRGGAVVREYAGEFGDVQGALAVLYDVESREEGRAFREATQHVPNPMAQDVPGEEPPDQGMILFAASDDSRAGHGHSHAHGSEDHDHTHVSHDAIAALTFNRGGGLLARVMHGHFEILAQAPGGNP
jgi:hypothetical protein